MKMPMRWHKERLENNERYLNEQREILERTKQNYDRNLRQYHESLEQYQEAVKSGVDGYDNERFGKKCK